MNKRIVSAASALAVAAFVPLTVIQVQAASASAAGLKAQQRQPGAITIESWLYAVPSENVLSGTVWDCFQISGAITDEGGGPTWTGDTSYNAPNTMTSGGVTAASKECADKVPAGGFVLVPPPEAGQFQFAQYTAGAGSPGGLTTVYAVHTIAGHRGDIYITFSGTYNFTNSVVPVKEANGTTVDVQPLTTGPQCTWLITGGTGAYTGLQGDGTCFANAQNTFPWINHTEHGQVWWS
ncbi:MAG TPA: hypothetical protein VEJ84_10355 [Acidimicrobiales bacterium]|nr:hypothetical protein [Acidimicrobiales bacterium]